MIRVKYPDNIDALLEEYYEIFEASTKNDFDLFFSQKKFQNHHLSFKRFILFTFEELFSVYKTIQFTKGEIEKLKTILDYGKYQPKITDFFMKYRKELNISTCFYCNIDYIFVYNGYKNILEFLKFASPNKIKKVLGTTQDRAKKITDNCSNIETIEDVYRYLREEDIERLKLLNVEEIRDNHFTLDHVIDKGKYPLFSLCFFNLLPSCYVCNSKLKHTHSLITDDGTISPTHTGYSFDKQAKFKVSSIDKKSLDNLRDENDFKLTLETNAKFNLFETVFRLEGRYQFHKNEILDLIQKSIDYPESHLQSIADMLDGNINIIKRDIFGKELFDGDLATKPITKLKRDIARQLKISGIENLE